MKQLYKTSDILNFLVKWDCNHTAKSIEHSSDGAEFLDSEFVKKMLIVEIYEHLELQLNKYTYISGR
jgi:hypothetical protein